MTGRALAARMRTLMQYATVLQTPGDLYRYARLRIAYAHGAATTSAATIRLRALGGAAVICRASQDVYTFKHTFLVGFHRPPVALAPNATIVDLGSNVGFTVADLAYRYPYSRIVGVEMDARNFALARQNTEMFGDRVSLVHAAVWTEDGVVQYAGDADDAFHIDDEPGAADAPHASRRTAPAKRIGTILDDAGIDRVDYMKIDIEGAEGPIFRAPLDWTGRVRSLKVEVHAPVTVAECRSVLEAAGFTCWNDARHPACLCATRP